MRIEIVQSYAAVSRMERLQSSRGEANKSVEQEQVGGPKGDWAIFVDFNPQTQSLRHVCCSGHKQSALNQHQTCAGFTHSLRRHTELLPHASPLSVRSGHSPGCNRRSGRQKNRQSLTHLEDPIR